MKENDYRNLVFSYLAIQDYKSAAKLLWPWIDQNEQSLEIWDHIHSHDYTAIVGHASASKTFTAAQYYLLDWWTDPQNTYLAITSDTIKSMEKRVWADIKKLITTTKVKMIGEIIDSKKMVVYDKNDSKNCISAIAAESTDAQSKIQGVHTKRTRVLIDEADNKFSNSIWGAVANLGSSGSIKVTGLANAEDPHSAFGQHIEPIDGMGSINPEVDKTWKSRRNYWVMRLDGLKSPNIAAKKDVYPYLLTNKGMSDIELNNGVNSIEWWKYVRAWYAPSGQTSIIFPEELITKCKTNKIVWYAARTRFAACDPAFEDGDKCVVVFGWVGPLANDPTKTGVLIDKFLHIKRMDKSKEDMIDIGDQIIKECKAEGVEPEHFGLDSTGNAHGLAAYIRTKWSKAVHKVSFNQAPTSMKILGEDSMTAEDRFDRFVTEIWYSAREWCKFGHVQFENVPMDFTQELSSRLYKLVGRKVSAETKKDMKKRLGRSPDFADAFAVLMHIVRIWKHSAKPSMTNLVKSSDPLRMFKAKRNIYTPNYRK